MRRHHWAFLPLVLSLTSCHVVERAKQCAHLSKVMKDASAGLSADVIGESPASKTLRKKARLYGQLAARIEQVYVRSLEVKTQKSAMIAGLVEIEKQLNEAATAVDAQTEFEKRPRTAPPLTGRPTPWTGQSPHVPPTHPIAQRPGEARPGIPQTPSSAPASARAETGPGATNERPKPPVIVAPRTPSSRPQPSPADLLRNTIYSRQYQRAKRAAEGAASGLKAATNRLEQACR